MTPKRPRAAVLPNRHMRVAEVMRVIEEARYPVAERPPNDPAPLEPRGAVIRSSARAVIAPDDDTS